MRKPPSNRLSATPNDVKRRIEIIAFEYERVVTPLSALPCPTCQQSEWLTTRQAAALVQVTPQTIRRWLATGRAHGIRTAGGQHRLCRHSLFR